MGEWQEAYEGCCYSSEIWFFDMLPAHNLSLCNNLVRQEN